MFCFNFLFQPQLIAAVKFIAHLVNQQVAHELVALELLTVLLEQPTDDSVEVAVDFVKECGSILQDLCPKGLHGELSTSCIFSLQLFLCLLFYPFCVCFFWGGGLIDFSVFNSSS